MAAVQKVIWVPGLLAAALSQQYKNREVNVWLNETMLLQKGLDPLQLADDGISPGPLASPNAEIIAPGQIGTAYPSGIIAALQARGIDFTVYTYDWRLSVAGNGDRLGNYIQGITAGDNFAVVGYSLGGLLARRAYATYTGDRSKWIRLVTLGTPHGGTFDATALLAGGFPQGTVLYFLALCAGASLERFSSLDWFKASQRTRWNQVITSWPSLYELAPVNSQAQNWSTPYYKEINSVGTYPTNTEGLTQQKLDAGKAVREGLLAAWDAGPRPPLICVAGVGYSTPDDLLDPAKIDLAEGYARTFAGDGAVALNRATMQGVPLVTVNQRHDTLPIDSTVLSKLVDWIDDGIGGDVTIPPVPPTIIPSKLERVDTLPPPLTTWDALVRRGDP